MLPGWLPELRPTNLMLYYPSGYLFTVLGAFTVICIVMTQVEAEDLTSLGGFTERAPCWR
jgi:hypothetical protein